MADRTLMPKDVAEALGVSVDTVGRYAREGLIPFATTPKGHRRFDLAEVRVALADIESPGLTRLRPAGRAAGSSRSRLVPGPAVRPSASSLLQEDLRATRTAPTSSDAAADEQPKTGALDDVLGHARRVLVAR